MKPVKTPHSYDLTGEGVDPLPVEHASFKGKDVLISRWRMSWPERLWALATGDAWLVVLSLQHPPVQVMAQNPYEQHSLKAWLRERGFWLSWQNLNEHRNGQVKGSGLKHGRACLHTYRNYRDGDGTPGPTFNAEWVFGKLGLAAMLELDRSGDDDAMAHLAVPGASLFVGVGRLLPQRWLPRQAREIGFTVHDGHIWWKTWSDPHEWRSTTPRWRDGNFSPADFLLGRHAYSTRDLSTHRAEIPMPEGVYPATVVLSEATWKRPRWPWAKRLLRAEVTPDQGIPHPGKGENSYDLDEDATYSLTTQAASVSEAVGKFVSSVLRDRERHGGPNWRPRAAEVS